MFDGGGVLPLPEGKPIRVTVNVGEFILATETVRRALGES